MSTEIKQALLFSTLVTLIAGIFIALIAGVFHFFATGSTLLGFLCMLGIIFVGAFLSIIADQ